VRDEGGELFDLESQGASPRLLRRHLRLRAAVVAAVGIAGGLATGAALSALVLSLVRVTANLAAPQPPLVLAADWRLVGIGAAAFLALAVAAVVAGSRTAFRSRAAGRFREVGA
jgi:ABC-type antimicrobial peptide transport system permease subunit